MKHINITIVTAFIVAALSGLFYLANQEMLRAINQNAITTVAATGIGKVLCVLMIFVTLYKYTSKVELKEILWNLPKALFVFFLFSLGVLGAFAAYEHTSGVLMSILVVGGVALAGCIAEAWVMDLLDATRELYS